MQKIVWKRSLRLLKKKGEVRTKNIVKRLIISKLPIIGALYYAAKLNLINYNPYDVIALTQQGEKTARDIIKRHKARRDFFVKVLALNNKESEEVACGMEHVMSTKVLERIVSFLEFIENGDLQVSKHIKKFKKQYQQSISELLSVGGKAKGIFLAFQFSDTQNIVICLNKFYCLKLFWHGVI